MPEHLAITSIGVRGFRNLAVQAIPLSARFNVLAGDNGQGKTSVIEAIYLVATSRSFRTGSLAECVAHEATDARLAASVLDTRDGGLPRAQLVALERTRRTVQVDGKRPRTLAAYALATPVVVFEPSSLSLSQGSAGERRKLLDRVAVHVAARTGGGEALVHDAERYRRALAQRKMALKARADARTLDSFERIMVEHGMRIVAARASATEALVPGVASAFLRIAQSPLELTLAYAPRGPTSDVESFARALADRRVEDARRGSTGVGPHLDDLTLHLDGRPARQVGSQGQHRAIVLALKAAELATIAEARGVQPVLLLDDVSSELDPLRSAALFRFLHEQVGQVVLTTTRPELIELGGARTDFQVRQGVVTRL